MAISKMYKIMVVSHRAEATELLEKLQEQGTCQILNAEQGIICKDNPELQCANERPKELENLVNRLDKTIGFLSDYSQHQKGLASVLAPRAIIDNNQYNSVINDASLKEVVGQAEKVQSNIEKIQIQIENYTSTLEMLDPWKALDVTLEELRELEQASCILGLIGSQKLTDITDKFREIGVTIEQIGSSGTKAACIIICLNEQVTEVQKILRAGDFETVNFESMTGTTSELIEHYNDNLDKARQQLSEMQAEATKLTQNLIKLHTLYDHSCNLLNREHTKAVAPATAQTVILEGWVRKKDYNSVAKTVSQFSASSLSIIEPAKDEDVPVEIENNKAVKPFEVITRLYGMPHYLELDPTVFLAPFFALFFGLCLTDAGYGLIMLVGSIFFIKKTQGDKKFGYLFLGCSVITVICGAITGGWFGDAIQILNIPVLNSMRNFFLKFGFDPTSNPMTFFKVSLVIGYIQLMAGIAIAFFDKLIKKDYAAAVCDHLVWLVMLNMLAAYGFCKSGMLFGPEHANIFLIIAAVPAATIFMFSHREGGIVARLGMGFYNLASTMFYIGDILSYVRLMALGMVTAGFAIAINQMASLAGEIKIIGPILAILVLIGGHFFNLFISALGSFVHSLRLQYVEFFPKFFSGGGSLFTPFNRNFKYVYINDKSEQ